ncbi:hypothetical protein EVAR_75897_1 [Eumeta japonica]|uniref:Reverse transcriptase domain-containing protein n=1 Tax=Eumeta variegata TaxID=151549 RepID=A0A4C1UXE4_EUMVA|nr:hypothetical protein EVAR_75897_1 [Eumeta japonica]
MSSQAKSTSISQSDPGGPPGVHGRLDGVYVGVIKMAVHSRKRGCMKINLVSKLTSKILKVLYETKEFGNLWCRLRMDELSFKCLLYTDDQVILAPSACGLQEMVNKVNDSVKKSGMKINVGKIKMIVFERSESTTECHILIRG